ncbi:MAG: Bcr/CflA family efflux MFS transporter [Caldilinea sp. CFX5]|nr:Bcr/CflA family efflux MFS transporter [Caldilinea sp. CFX5]
MTQINTTTTVKPVTTPQSSLPFAEFVALMACMTAMVALSIDAMLPALATIAQDLGAQRANDSQLIVSLIFLGLSIGQIFYGPLSDSTGRKPAIYLGIGIYIIGSLLAFLAWNFQIMLIGRFLQGIGAAGPRSVAVALVRDQYAGRAMARVMSFVMTVFILVPIVAPMLGQGILLVAHWRAIFGLYLLLALLVGGWFMLRQPETLASERRIPFQVGRIGGAFREVFINRIALGYTVMAGLASGGFVGYLNSAPQIFQQQYGLGAQFPFYFATLALALGSASYVNAQLVMRFGMRALSRWALLILGSLSLLFLLIAWGFAGQPPLWGLMAYLLLGFFAVGILFGNLNARAMEPLGHIAGVGAAVVGSLSTLISTLIGGMIGQSYNGTVLPLVGGFALMSVLALLVMMWAEKRSANA